MSSNLLALLTCVVVMFALWKPTTCRWRWKTNDALIQHGWPENDPLKFKRASSSIPPRHQMLHSSNDIQRPDQDEEGTLVFEGRYFKPNEVPPPPPFMIAENNWRGSSTPENHKIVPVPNIPVIGIGGAPLTPPNPLKFTFENVKTFTVNDKGITKDSTSSKPSKSEEKGSASDSQNVFVSSTFPIDDLQQLKDDGSEADFHEIFKDAPKCFTTSDNQGRCVHFKQCFPVVFNVIDGTLRNPGLAKLLYQSSGPCNASMELNYALRKLPDKKAFLSEEFYNQTVCCPGFKHPPVMRSSWKGDIRNARLTIETIETQQEAYPKGDDVSAKLSSTFHASNAENGNMTSAILEPKPINADIDDSMTIPRIPVEIDESSVEEEAEEENQSANHDESIEDVGEDIGNNDSIMEEEEVRMADTEIVKEPATIIVFNNDTGAAPEERHAHHHNKWGGYHSKKTKEKYVSSVPDINLTPAKCRQQLYGMPRGHWPWMAAIVINSRHICSGAIVDEQHIITAAHCVYLLSEADVRKLRIIVGDRVMYSAVDGPHFWRKVSRIMTHVNYNQETFASDIAILKMNTPVPFSRNIQAISIPDPATVDTIVFGKGIVAGWSGADIGQPAFEARAEAETVVDIMDKADCRDVYRGFALSGVASNTFCTKPANNTCVADSGAPLFVRVQNCWQLMGIMSWALGCSHFPEVYTDVSRYATWIRKHIE